MEDRIAVVSDDEDDAPLPPHAGQLPPPDRARLLQILQPQRVGAADGAPEANRPDPLVNLAPPPNIARLIDILRHPSAAGAAVAAAQANIPDPPVDLTQFLPSGFRAAVRSLQEGNGSSTGCLVVNAATSDPDEGRCFSEFVTLLGEGGRTFHSISLSADWRRLSVENVERLFRDVLPGHPTLKSISIDISHLPARFLKCLTVSVPTEKDVWSLSYLTLTGFAQLFLNAGIRGVEHLDHNEAIQAVVEMLNRNAALMGLNLSSCLQLDANQCRLICQAAAQNTHLWSLSLRVTEAFEDSLDGITASSLGSFTVLGALSDDAVVSLARRLRTNTVLGLLRLDTGHQGTQVLLELVRKYNYTIYSIDGNDVSRHAQLGQQFQPYMQRNAWIRRALCHLQRLKDRERTNRARRLRESVDRPVRGLDGERRGEYELLPQLLERVLIQVSEVPTALYRILKMGYANQVGDLLAAQTRRGRRRRCN